LAPDAVSMALFGPGVMLVAKAKPSSAQSSGSFNAVVLAGKWSGAESP
jgi:hypothetical protein